MVLLSRALAWGMAAAAGQAAAQTAIPHAPDEPRGPWTLLNPTPRRLMRPMSTDRPDTTESPFTVDAGHVQLEMSVVEFGEDGGDKSFSFAPLNLKLGLLECLDLQLLLEPHVREAGEDGSLRGAGPLGVRAKFNLWGNDGGDTALALMPFVSFPGGDHDASPSAVEFGLIVPFSAALTDRLGLGLMAEFDAAADDAGDLNAVFVHTAVLGFDVSDRVGLFAEFIGEAGSGPFSEYAASASAGATLGVGADAQFDLGVRAGLTDAAEDLAVFAGVSLRF